MDQTLITDENDDIVGESIDTAKTEENESLEKDKEDVSAGEARSNEVNSDGQNILYIENEDAVRHDQTTSPIPDAKDDDLLHATEASSGHQYEDTKEETQGDALEDMPIKVDVIKRDSSSAKTKDLDEEVGRNTAAQETVVAQNDNVSEKTSSGKIDFSEKITFKDVQFISDLSFSTQNSTLSVSGPEGSWRTIKSKINIDGEEKEETIHIFTEKFKKPFLGGFRHKITNVEYHNASSQTYPKRRIPPAIERFHRDTQTVFNKNQLQQTAENTSTQMTKPGCYVSNVTDRVLIPGVYETADEKFAKRLEKVIILQCHWRRWLATRYVHKLRLDKELRLEWERQEEIRKQKEMEDRIRKEFERRMNPRSKEDFDLLYAALERWRREEIAKIDASKSGPERKAALVGLLEQESYLIASIERHRIKANKENKEHSIKKFLDKAALPKKWRSNDGTTIEVDTPYTIRAQELRDLYNSLQMKYLTQEERLDVLLTLKHTVKEHECKLTHEIVELIDRETELLMRGVKDSNLDGLRQRISTLFIQFCKIPLFNPEAARLLKVPQDPSTLRKNVYFCPSCTSYLPSSEFPLASNSRIVGRCRRCAKLDNDARLRQDFSKFRSMLLALRRSEEEYNDGSKIAFIIQEADLRYLVENIWNGQSSLSALEDLHELVLVRWNKYQHWSPWNCILLTKEEAAAHSKLENINEGYGRIFIGKVHNRHVLAQKHFSKLNDIADKLHTRADLKMKEKTDKISV